MQIEHGISRVSVVTFLGGAGRPLPERRRSAGAGIPQTRSKPFGEPFMAGPLRECGDGVKVRQKRLHGL